MCTYALHGFLSLIVALIVVEMGLFTSWAVTNGSMYLHPVYVHPLMALCTYALYSSTVTVYIGLSLIGLWMALCISMQKYEGCFKPAWLPQLQFYW